MQHSGVVISGDLVVVIGGEIHPSSQLAGRIGGDGLIARCTEQPGPVRLHPVGKRERFHPLQKSLQCIGVIAAGLHGQRQGLSFVPALTKHLRRIASAQQQKDAAEGLRGRRRGDRGRKTAEADSR